MSEKEIDYELAGMELFSRSIEDAALRLRQTSLSSSQLKRSEAVVNKMLEVLTLLQLSDNTKSPWPMLNSYHKPWHSLLSFLSNMSWLHPFFTPAKK